MRNLVQPPTVITTVLPDRQPATARPTPGRGGTNTEPLPAAGTSAVPGAAEDPPTVTAALLLGFVVTTTAPEEAPRAAADA
jgi:hypothetical protein